jgi:hypothetical protein
MVVVVLGGLQSSGFTMAGDIHMDSDIHNDITGLSVLKAA